MYPHVSFYSTADTILYMRVQRKWSLQPAEEGRDPVSIVTHHPSSQGTDDFTHSTAACVHDTRLARA